MDACKYHPAQYATWHCPRCQMSLCMSCIVQDARSALPKCTLCRSDLQSLGISQVVTPFWQRLSAFFAYGFKPSSLTFIGVMSLLSVISAAFGLLFIVVMAISTKYLFSVTEETAMGELEPPSFSKILGDSGYSLFFKQLGVLLVMAMFTFAVANTFGKGPAFLVYGFILIGYPASTMLLAATRSFAEAINPLSILQIIRGIGLPYMILYAFLILLSLSSFWVLGVVLKVFPIFLAAPLSMAVSLYFGVVMFNMMGYALYQYHHELGLPIRREVVLRNLSPSASSGSNRVTPNNNALVEAEVQLKEGRYELALQSLQVAINQEPERVDIHEKMHALLLAMGDVVRARQHLDEFIGLLRRKRQLRRAVTIVKEMFSHQADFRPSQADDTLALAEELHLAREDSLALRLIINLHKRFPEFEGVSRAYLLAARIFSERLRDDAQAIKLLEFLVTYYPNAQEAGEIAQYLGVLRKLN